MVPGPGRGSERKLSHSSWHREATLRDSPLQYGPEDRKGTDN
jgi:hypothetical protein